MAKVNDDGEVRAGGGIVADVRDGSIFVLMVHRPEYDDWALPKGKVKGRESDEEAALREVQEEIGLSCRLGDEAGSTHYVDRSGRRKVVRYWLMSAKEGCQPRFEKEVDSARWFTLERAQTVATRSGDREFLSELSRAIVALGRSVGVTKRVHTWEADSPD